MLSFSALVWTYLGYPILLYLLSVFYKRKRVRIMDNDFKPKVSIIIPTYNEAKVIEEKLENTLELYYPKELLEILVIDGGSGDGTQALVRKFSSKGVKLIEEGERMGKASAINLGLKNASGEVVVITDANTFLDKNCLKMLVKNFSDKRVGAVSGRFIPVTVKEGVASKGESFYWRIEEWMKEKESLLDSPATLVGPITAIRKGIIERVGESNLAEDFEISVAVRAKGYKLVYEPNAKAYEIMPQTINDLFKQKKRVTIGTLQTLIKYKRILLNPKYGLYGLLILPSHKLLQTLTPFFLLIFATSLVFLKLYTSSILFSMIFNFMAASIFLCFVSIVASRFSLPINIKNFFNALSYFTLLQVILISGWCSYSIGKYQVKWEKMESVRISVRSEVD